MKESTVIPDFSLSGGIVYKLGCRLGLVKGTNTFRLGLALGLFSWGILMLMVLLHGMLLKSFSIIYLGAHVRLLIAIPLLFLAETWTFPRISDFVRNIVNSGMVTSADIPVLAGTIRRIEKLKSHWALEVLFILSAFILPLFVKLPGATGAMESIEKLMSLGSVWTKSWYAFFCLPLFRYLFMRWCWYLILWWYFLWQVQKLNLNLIPTHPDHAAGLGYLEVVQVHFLPLLIASSAIFASSFAENISSGAMKFEALYYMVPIIIVIYAVLFILPLYIFSKKLWKSKVAGLNEYMVMAHHFVEAFELNWVKRSHISREEMLGNADIQSLADLRNSMEIIENMRIMPASRKLIINLALTSIIPMLPLLLLKYPLLEIAGTLLSIFFGG